MGAGEEEGRTGTELGKQDSSARSREEALPKLIV